ncbi:sulfite exporter TauE/SafE family protein [Defluviimonas sp. SAOS-178_SWC]|uniref:sulfite exporter TauE/SafE family protein n=1 Tax=Defluviimonas sp. SAOS-178_SWC TaxID=3121287 RepID=UPI003221F834
MALPFGLSPEAAAFLLAAVLIAAIVRGFSGFGFSALVVVATGLVSDPLNAVAVALFCEVVMTLQAAKGIARDIDWRRVGLLLAGAAIGLPIGVHGLIAIGLDASRVAISLFILVMCGVLLAGWHTTREVRGWPNAVLGFASGVANGAAMAGLPVAAVFSAQPIPPRIFRATLIAYFAILDLLSLPVLLHAGLITRDTLVACAVALPLLLIGNHFGSFRFSKSAPTSFRRLAIGLLAILAVLGLLKSVI